jgi:hypothetical protein
MNTPQRTRPPAQRGGKQPPALRLPASPPPRNPVARALAERNAGAGKHSRSPSAERQADRATLRRDAADAMRER